MSEIAPLVGIVVGSDSDWPKINKVAAHTSLPVVSLPVPTPYLGGLDTLLSTAQKPRDVPVASVAVGRGGPRNAGLFAMQIGGTADPALRPKFADF